MQKTLAIVYYAFFIILGIYFRVDTQRNIVLTAKALMFGDTNFIMWSK